MKIFFVLLHFILFLFFSLSIQAVESNSPSKEEKIDWVSPSKVALYSLLIPGAGQFVIGNNAAGAGFLALYAGSVALGFAAGDRYETELENRGLVFGGVDEKNKIIYVSDSSLQRRYSGHLSNFSQFYSSYAAFRDQLATSSYYMQNEIPAPKESLTDLALAPFRWKHIADWKFYVPALAGLSYIVWANSGGEDEDERYEYSFLDKISKDQAALYAGAGMMPVAIGEEAFFRGFLNTKLSSDYGYVTGLLGSSALFGLAHVGRGIQADSITAGALGLYFGWAQKENGYKIGQSVAMHYWWNVVGELGRVYRAKHSKDKEIVVHLPLFYTQF